MKKNQKKAIKNISIFTVCCFFIYCLISCASVGKTFNYENRNKLSLGETTFQEATRLLGPSTSNSIKSNSNGTFKIVQYVYAKAELSSVASRVLILEFKDEVLNAKIYNSGFKGDNTQFNFFQYQNIRVGESTQEEVLMKLGTPSGMATYPTTVAGLAGACMQETATIWTWIHTENSKSTNTNIQSNSVAISFDKYGIVTEMETARDTYTK